MNLLSVNLIEIIGILIAWFTFRYYWTTEKYRVLNTIRSLLKNTGLWFLTAYYESDQKIDWLNPDKLVYRVETNIVTSVSLNSIFLGSKYPQLLVYFVQSITRFNQLVDTFLQYIFSSPELYLLYRDYYKENPPKINDDPKKYIERMNCITVKQYARKMYALQKAIHVQGIGRYEDYNGTTVPQLHKCFRNLKSLIESEFEKSFIERQGNFIYGDLIVLTTVLSLLFVQICKL